MEAKIHIVEEGVPKSMSKKRWKHTLGVAETAARLADALGLNSAAGRLAGLLHDCAKERTDYRLEDLVERGEVMADGFTLRTPALHHTVLGCLVAQREYDIHDADVLEAIRYHAMGAPGLGQLARVIYVSDWIEPGRDFDGREKLARLAEENFDAALHAVAANKLARMVKKGRAVHPYALYMYNESIPAACKSAPSAQP